MKFWMTTGIVVCLAALGACSTRGSYESIRQTARNECNEKFSDAERSACLERTQDSYDEYTRKREAVVQGRE
jgi:hypothetical protein